MNYEKIENILLELKFKKRYDIDVIIFEQIEGLYLVEIKLNRNVFRFFEYYHEHSGWKQKKVKNYDDLYSLILLHFKHDLRKIKIEKLLKQK